MTRLLRAAAVLAFAMAYLAQPLALDACSVSCEAARAARSAVVAAPCHHTTSCASQISQPAPAGATIAAPTQARPTALAVVRIPAPLTATHLYYCVSRTSRPPDLPGAYSAPVPLRV
jgi:hypothetical protein